MATKKTPITDEQDRLLKELNAGLALTKTTSKERRATVTNFFKGIPKNEISNFTVVMLGLKIGTVRCLNAGEIHYIGDLIQLTEADLLKVLNVGPKTLSKVKAALKSRGLALGTKLDNWVSPICQKSKAC